EGCCQAGHRRTAIAQRAQDERHSYTGQRDGGEGRVTQRREDCQNRGHGGDSASPYTECRPGTKAQVLASARIFLDGQSGLRAGEETAADLKIPAIIRTTSPRVDGRSS